MSNNTHKNSDAVISHLKKENEALKAQVTELKYFLHNLQSANDSMREDIENELAAECGCVTLDGFQKNAAYQDMVGVLLMNDYTVEVKPIEQGRRLKITIKESEV